MYPWLGVPMYWGSANPRFVLTPLAAVVIFLFSPAANAAFRHAEHRSETELNCNLRTGSIEVTMSVWSLDIEDAIAKSAGTNLKIGTAAFEKALKKYVLNNVRVKMPSATTACAANWIGYQIDPLDSKRVWIFFEIPQAASSTSWTVTNRMLAEIEPEQENVLTLKHDQGQKTIVCDQSNKFSCNLER